MPTELTSEDEGKTVIRGDETVGRIVDVEGGTAYVDPDPSITDTIMSKLGWSKGEGTDGDSYPLREDSVEEVTGDEVRLREDI